MRTLLPKLLLPLLLLTGCTPPGTAAKSLTADPSIPLTRSPAGIPVVRVRILENQSSFRLSASADPTFAVNNSSSRTLAISGRTIILALTPQGWSLGGAVVAPPPGSSPPGNPGILHLTQSAEGSLAFNNNTYRGSFRLIPTAPGKFDVVNDVEVDAYLKSVVSKELYKSWHPETYRAQAVAARTYALYEVATNPPGRQWDVNDDERSQVYGGLAAESPLSQSAVEATAGIVLTYGPEGNERIFKTYFSACCGGSGQNPTDAFLTDPTIPPLAEKNAGSLCSDSPRYRWGPVVISKPEATRRIRLWATARSRPEQAMATLTKIEVSHTNRFGRPIRYILTDNQNQRYSFAAEELRTALNTGAPSRALFSGHLAITTTPTAFAINGAGSGHAVGMCQYCAQALATQGHPHEEILRYSYPGAKLARAY